MSRVWTACLVVVVALMMSAPMVVCDGEETIIDMMDGNGDSQLNATELGSLLAKLVDGDHAREHCPGVAELMTEHDANSDGKLSATELKDVSYEVLPCAMEATCSARITARVDDDTYTCESEEEEHDDHRRRLAAGHDHGGDSAASLTLMTDETEWHCTLVAAADDDDHHLEEAEIWGYSLLAGFLVSIVSLLGIVVLGKVSQAIVKARWITALAAGALLSGAILHLIPEAAAEHGGMDAELGLALLGGFMGMYILEAAIRIKFDHGHHHKIHDSDSDAGDAPAEGRYAADDALARTMEDGEADVDISKPVDAGAPSAGAAAGPGHAAGDDEIRKESLVAKKLDPVAYSVIIGDAFHNLADGFIIGSAFHGCSMTVAWTVTGVLALHEVPQELADFFILRKAGMSVAKAALFNFLSAVTTILGILIVNIAGEIDSAVSVFLVTIGAGALLFIASVEILPDLLTAAKPGNAKNTIINALAIFVGIAIVGLVTLADTHCEEH